MITAGLESIKTVLVPLSGVLTLVVGAAVFVFYVVTPRVAGKLFLLDWSFMAEEEARDEGETAGPLELDTVSSVY